MSAERPLGDAVEWQPSRRPSRCTLRGKWVLVRPLDAGADARSLHAASASDPTIWTYLPYGPFGSDEALERMLRWAQRQDDLLFFALCPLPHADPAGVAAYQAVVAEHGTIEIGDIWFGERLRRTTAATEAIYLLAAYAFDELGYRRLEWKCNALNAPSRRAAERLGFRFEGVFRKHRVVKGRNRDTAWYAITDDDWAALRPGYVAWLDPGNFDAEGRQRRSLRDVVELTGAGLIPPAGGAAGGGGG